jgi:hypothetical protein
MSIIIIAAGTPKQQATNTQRQAAPVISKLLNQVMNKTLSKKMLNSSLDDIIIPPSDLKVN